MRFADCHPDEQHWAKGLCQVCYDQQRSRERKLKRKEAREPPWVFTCTENELYYLAGILEGEACFRLNIDHSFCLYAIIRLKMTDEDIVTRVRDIVGVGTVRAYRESDNENRKLLYRWQVTHSKAIEVMRKIRPLMGKRRGEQIDHIIEEHVRERLKYGRIPP